MVSSHFSIEHYPNNPYINSPIHTSPTTIPSANGNVSYSSACAAAGQIGLMSLYETMFNQYDITTSQVLLTAFDFTSPERRRNVQYVISQLLALGIVPLLNENDAVSANQGYQLFGNTFSDNDSLAALVSIEMSAQILILLTDVDGVYDRPPSDPNAKLIDVFRKATDFKVGEKSLQGRGGMGAKVDAAMNAITGGVHAVIIAAGSDTNVIGRIMEGGKAGTLFLCHEDDLSASDGNREGDITAIPISNNTVGIKTSESGNNLVSEAVGISDSQHVNMPPTPSPSGKVATGLLSIATAHDMALRARKGGRQLQSLTTEDREKILIAIADEIQKHEVEILKANADDMAKAELKGDGEGSNIQSLKRLLLTKEKLATLCDGIRQISRISEPLGKLISRTELAQDLILDKITCPIGVLLIIFESRPDCLPQIISLALRSGNGLLLKGGKEAENSNSILFHIISNAIETASGGQVSRDVIGLVKDRATVSELLQLDDSIDLVIPRGSGELVKYIKDNTKIPVMGHAEGVCHVYIDEFADEVKATRIILDAKTDYPSACNAAETLLLHESLVESGIADRILRALRAAGVACYGGDRAAALGLTEKDKQQKQTNFNHEYGDLAISVEVVSSLEQAIEHINKYGSGHTECIVTQNKSIAEIFLNSIDSACIFHNSSTRFADGFRFGLGAEVGISTGRIHARGPVGVEGLLTYKWLLRSAVEEGSIVGDFGVTGKHRFKYTHKSIPI